MPQMAPINWTSLYLLFIMLFLMMIILNYFTFTYMPKYKTSQIKISSIFWKW
uniref:ATP synthase complex subunit 8 n=1 Tax=Dryocoetes villosus TaxID=1367338 RepID=A0A343A4X9_9CUCU|nr:ATP synthase F0 subunit 8 [Dryocoetes villosus]AOY39607.1 ATP synthase F0 subunit 8 [Dryocoetes villosus]